MSETTRFYVVVCDRCEPLLPMPFDDDDKRWQWIRAHYDGTSHLPRAMWEEDR